jgi:hypothetical protein
MKKLRVCHAFRVELAAPLGLLVVVTFLASAASAVVSEHKLVDSNGSAGAQLGFDVALDGDYAIAGAPLDATAGGEAGKAVVFFFNGTSWSQQGELWPSISPSDGRFGWSVDLEGDLAVVGAPYLFGSNPSAGLAYVFRRSGSSWGLEQGLEPGDGADGDRYGTSVALQGNTIVVGAPAQASDAGGVYIYVPNPGAGPAWVLQQKIDPPIGPGTSFGGQVDVSGDLMAASTTGSANGGFVHTHRRFGSSWSITQLIEGSDTVPSDAFGRTVAADADRLLVGANLHTHSPSQGAGYIIERDAIAGTWPETAELLEVSVGNPPDNLGWSGDIEGNLAALGAIYGDGIVNDSGLVYAYRQSSSGAWHEVASLSASDGFASQSFGSSAAVSGDCILVGASSDDDQASQAGAAYVYCGLPDLLVEVTIDIICCVEIPDYSTAPVEFTTRFVNLGSEPRTIARWVDLIDPEGRVVRVVSFAEMEILEGESWSQDFETARHVGGPPGVYSLVTYWQDGEDVQTELAQFEMIETSAVPTLTLPGLAVMLAGIGGAGWRAMRRRSGAAPDRRSR